MTDLKKYLTLTLSLWFLIGAVITMPNELHAFTDEIGVPMEEVWQGTYDVFSENGVKSMGKNKGEITSNWYYDEVRRSRGFFKFFTRRRLQRRYRMKAKIGKGEIATELMLQVRVQERSVSSAPAIPWKPVIRLQSEDYLLEREFFHKILRQISKNKMKPATAEQV